MRIPLHKFLPRLLTALLCLLQPRMASADALSELKARLSAMSGHDRLKASVEFENWNRTGDDKKPRIVDGKVSAVVEQTGTGLKIQWSNALLQQASLETRQNKSDPEQETPTRDALSALNAYDLQQYFESSERLLNVLENASLSSEQSETLDGKPSHVLNYTTRPALSEHDRKYVKQIEAGGKLWLDADGYPLALDDHYTVHGSAFVVISFSSTQHDEYRYARIGNHLVTTRHVSENQGSGGGEQGESRQVTSLQFSVPEVATGSP